MSDTNNPETCENKLGDVNMYFKLPIYYNKNKMSLKTNISNDLELVETTDSSYNSIYSHLFNTNNHELTNNIIQQISEYYTTDQVFLSENQQFLREYKKEYDNDTDFKNIINIWNDIKGDTGFKEKYNYVDWSMFEFLNNSEYFLQIMSIYNMLSPVISFCVPAIILIIPFFIIKLKGLNLTVNEYIEILKLVAENHAVGKLFTKFNDVTTNEKIYFIVSAAFYLFTIYQNVLVCIRFNHNMIKIHKYLKIIQQYLKHTIDKMNNYLLYSSNLTTHADFNNNLHDKIKILSIMRDKLTKITEYKFTNCYKIFEIGHVLKCFYELYDSKIYNDVFMYSFGFNGYLMCIDGLLTNIENKKINFCNFVSNNKKTIFKNGYYAALKDEKLVKNTVKLNKNLIITGTNASGKTTILKSTLINLIFSQQFGCGCYESAKISPFKYIHCYLNIPDTCGRDSLFQAEARRCKEIIDVINANKQDTHFCVFDELYSGTNPEEAVLSAKSFMEYVVKNKNVSCLLTTHFVKVCKKLKKNKDILNCHMETFKNNNKITYSYSLKKGISEIKGGINVLCDMGYPREIIENTM